MSTTSNGGSNREFDTEVVGKPAVISDIRETKDYDIVVIGAGSPGVP
jgi:hypothetical protein